MADGQRMGIVAAVCCGRIDCNLPYPIPNKRCRNRQLGTTSTTSPRTVHLRGRRRQWRRVQSSPARRGSVHHLVRIDAGLCLSHSCRLVSPSAHSAFISLLRHPFRNGGVDCDGVCPLASDRVYLVGGPMSVEVLDHGLPRDARGHCVGWHLSCHSD